MVALVLDIKSINPRKGGCLKFTIRIVEQVLRGADAFYTSSTGFRFYSMALPALSHAHNTEYGGGPVSDALYLRGRAKGNDNKVLHTQSVKYITQLKTAVKEYNEAKATLCVERS